MSSSGSVDFNSSASATVTILNPDVFGFRGTISVSFNSNGGFSGSLSGEFGAFGIKISAGASFYISSGYVKLDAFISLQITPAFSFKVWTPWKTYQVHVPALVISGTWSKTFGALTDAQVPPPPPVIATKTGNRLRLNMGADASYRGSDYPSGDETHDISWVGTGSSVGDKIKVSAFGYEQVYDNITEIMLITHRMKYLHFCR